MKGTIPGFDPESPYVRGSSTSKAAAAAIDPSADILRERVFESIVKAGAVGMTDAEMQTALMMEGSTQRPRRVELVRAGRVQDSGRRRPTPSGRKAVVWVAV